MIDRIVVLGGGSAGFIAAISLKTQAARRCASPSSARKTSASSASARAPPSPSPTSSTATSSIDPSEFHRDGRARRGSSASSSSGARGLLQLHLRRAVRHAATRPCRGRRASTATTTTTSVMYDGANSAPDDARQGVRPTARTARPAIRNDVAYHIENDKFVALPRSATRPRSASRSSTTPSATSSRTTRGVAGLLCTLRQAPQPADLYVDCSGFRSVLLGKTLGEPFVSFKTQPVLRPRRRRRVGARAGRADPALHHLRDDGRRLVLADRARAPHQPRLRLLLRLHLRRRGRARVPREEPEGRTDARREVRQRPVRARRG